MTDLPKGFVVDAPASGLPEGFQVDQPSAAPMTAPADPREAMRERFRQQHQATMAKIRDPDWEGMARRADDLVRGAAEGMTLGFADEIAAAADTMSGLGAGQTYEENLAAQRARDVQSDPAVRLMGNIAGA